MKYLLFVVCSLAMFAQATRTVGEGAEPDAGCRAEASKQTEVSRTEAAILRANAGENAARVTEARAAWNAHLGERKGVYDACVAKKAATPAPATPAQAAPPPTQTQPQAVGSPVQSFGPGQIIQYCGGLIPPPGSQLIISTSGCLTFTNIQPPPAK